MSGLQQLWSGISPCMQPGVADCVVWWDAWAVVVSSIAVLATVFLGFMTLRLGRAANRATAAAVAIAKSEADARRRNEADERIVILLWLVADVGTQVVNARGLVAEAKKADAKSRFVNDGDYRSKILAKLAELELPVASALRERLHLLGHPLAGRLARAIGLATALKTQFNVDYEQMTDEMKESFFRTFSGFVSVLCSDLEAVSDAATQASVEAKIVVTLNGDWTI